jgi:hypothetical protein
MGQNAGAIRTLGLDKEKIDRGQWPIKKRTL